MNQVPTPSLSQPAAPTRKPRWWLWGTLAALVVIALFLGTCWLLFTLSLSLSGGGGGARYRPELVAGPAWGPEIAVLMLQGPIVSTSDSVQSAIVVQEVEALLRQLNRDPQVRALVLYINSPGGGVAASERLYYALQQMDKPIVAYFEDVAASGGYYIAMAADEIVANPGTLTGSIGVIAVFPYAEELLDRVGVGFTIIKSGPAKDMGGLHRRMTPEEQAHVQAIVDEMYQRFVDVVVQGRNLSREDVVALADGRVYSGQQAYELGLVDRLGYEQDAVERARELAGIRGRFRVVRYVPVQPLFSWLSLRGPGTSPWTKWLQLQPGVYYLWLP